MKKYLFIALALFVSCSTSRQITDTPVTTSVTILHWNDFHSQNVPFTVTTKTEAGRDTSYLVGGTAALLGYINQFREGRSDVAVLNAGDDFQGTPISSITYGRSQIELLNIISPHVVTLGNHEFDYGLDSLRANISRAEYPIVCANVLDSVTSTTLVPPYTVVSAAGAKLGIVGLAPPDLGILVTKESLRGLKLRDVDRVLDEAIADLRHKHQPDLIVVLSHMGVDKDTQLAVRRNDVDIIVGGHTHTPLFTPIKKNRAIIVQAGHRGRYLGKLDVTIDLKGDSVVTYEGRLIETRVDGVTPDPVAAAKVAELEASVEAPLNEVIGTLTTRWDRRSQGKGETNIGSFEADVFREAAGTDIGFINSAGIRKNLEPGPITVRDIREINPFGNTLVTFSVRGDTLRKMMEWQTAIASREFLQVSGLSYTYDSSKPKEQMLISLLVGGRPVVDTARYSICTNNYVAGHLDAFFGISRESVELRETGIVDRDAVIDHIRKKKTISSHVEGRIVDVNQLQRGDGSE